MPDPWRAALLLVAVCMLVSLPRARGPFPACHAPGLRRDGAMPVVVCHDPEAAPLEGAARLLFGLPLDVNHAEASALESLPGIGATRAQAIVDGRPYAEVAELRRVPGIGPALLARIRPLVAVRVTGRVHESRGTREPIAFR